MTYLDLVHGRQLKPRGTYLLDMVRATAQVPASALLLERTIERNEERQVDALVGHPNGLDLACVARVNKRTPGLEPLLLPGEATVDEVEVEVV